MNLRVPASPLSALSVCPHLAQHRHGAQRQLGPSHRGPWAELRASLLPSIHWVGASLLLNVPHCVAGNEYFQHHLVSRITYSSAAEGPSAPSGARPPASPALEPLPASPRPTSTLSPGH